MDSFERARKKRIEREFQLNMRKQKALGFLCIAIVVIIFWYIQNTNGGEIEDMGGLILPFGMGMALIFSRKYILR